MYGLSLLLLCLVSHCRYCVVNIPSIQIHWCVNWALINYSFHKTTPIFSKIPLFLISYIFQTMRTIFPMYKLDMITYYIFN